MKAIIMAGGEGSRLRPLTCCRPKPMVPVLNRPIMTHIVELLKSHGITEIGVTLQYMPGAIRDYFGDGSEYGVKMRYFVEEVPLGTAGSVKNAASFLDETFIVISGDALTDLDLSRAVRFHRDRGSLATLVLTRVACPLEYGVVITAPDGKVTRFLEKPGWGEVFSDTVNTGIYVLEPEVLDYFAPGRMFDFSKDLFPLLLADRKPLYGLVLPGYWCDIGNLAQYLEAHYDALSGKVKIPIPGEEIAKGIWLEEGATLHDSAVVNGPVLIGAGCQIGAGCRIESFSVLGRGCQVRERASIKRSVVWDNVFIGRGAALRGAVTGSRVQVQAGAAVYEGAVVGDHSIIRENGLVKPEVKLWPHKLVETGATAGRSLVWGTCTPKKIFGYEGIAGIVNVEIGPEFAAQAGAVLGSVCGSGARVAVSSDSYPASRMIKEGISLGLQSAGAAVLDLGSGVTPVHRFAVRGLDAVAGVHVKVSPESGDRVIAVFTNGKGGNISRSLERKIENALAREDYSRVGPERLIAPQIAVNSGDAYIEAITKGLSAGWERRTPFRAVLAFDRLNLTLLVRELAGKMGFIVEEFSAGREEGYAGWRALKEMLPVIAGKVVESGAGLGAVIDPNAERLILIDEKGEVIQDDLFTALLALIVLKGGTGPVVVPVTAPRAIESLAERYRGRVVRTKTALQDFLEKVLVQDESGGEVSRFFLYFDALAALARVIDYTAGRGVPLSVLLEEIPSFFTDRRAVPVPWEAKGRVIRRLIQEAAGERLELLDGVKVYHPDGWALVLPDPDEPLCRVFSEGSTMEIAESLTEFYVNKISEIAEIRKSG
ncbi:MAG: mannose-1-phosphate guanyltransferase [Firmicutes bacterium]|nr:mannose-1-phosphate guanyltransferase [Bacillota bacterium]